MKIKVEIGDILKSEEINTMLENFSKDLEISVWIAGPEIEKINKVSKTWREKPAKKEMKRCGFLQANCIPGRIKMRKRAIEKREPVDEICPLGLHIFTCPIYYNEDLIGFFEGDGAKSKELDESYEKEIEEISRKWKFDANIVKNCIGYKTRAKTTEEMYSMMGMVVSTINIYVKMITERKAFSNELEAFNNSIKQTARSLQMLGINTAIESARLGEAGKGISVVANEIKKVGDSVFKEVALVGDAIRRFETK
jgi:hypothetical protein